MNIETVSKLSLYILLMRQMNIFINMTPETLLKKNLQATKHAVR